MAIRKREFGSHSKDNGDEWWFYLCEDTDKHELFVVVETEFGGKRSKSRTPLAEYLASGNRGVIKLKELISTLIDE